jgi:hypothetical protein
MPKVSCAPSSDMGAWRWLRMNVDLLIFPNLFSLSFSRL